MAATVAATDYKTMLVNSFRNIHSLSEASVNLKDRLSTWKLGFFALLNKEDPEEAKVHQWVIPTNELEKTLPATQEWYEVEQILQLLQNTLVATFANGFLPAGASFEADMVTVFNAAWT